MSDNKQILRAFGAQDDMLASFVKEEREETIVPIHSFSVLLKGSLPTVILSERAERVRAKDLLHG